jgi:hypothetical protein
MLAAAQRRFVLVLALTAIFVTIPIGSAHALPAFKFSTTTLTFSSTAVGDMSAGMSVVVTNLASSSQTVSSLAGGAPPDADFTGFQTCGGVVLAASASCAFTYALMPLTVGAHSTTTSFSINGQDSGAISLSGTATSPTGVLSGSGGALAFTGFGLHPLVPGGAALAIALGLSLLLLRRRSAA